MNDLSSYDNYEQGFDRNKQTIYWDVDDVILNSSVVVVDIINKKENKNKKFEDVKDWTYRSISRNMTKEKIENIYGSDEFWSGINFIDGILDLFDKLGGRYNHSIVTHGREDNQKRKKEYLFSHPRFGIHLRNNAGYYEVPNNKSKSYIDMSDGIQIDDNCNNLIGTNARIKILFKNSIDTDYNTDYGKFGNIDNLYIVNTVEELEQILMFNLEFGL